MSDYAMTSDEFWRWPATRLARAIAAGDLSSREVVASCLQRIDAVNPKLNALVEVRPEESLAAARLADDMVTGRQELGPLHGVPVAIKINTDQAGYATTDGVVAFAGAIADRDSAQVSILRRAGAVLLGRSNSPAFAYRWFTSNDLHGRTLNPWDATRTPGGSSGGASSAVASGMVPLAQGNDIAGSIRYPAHVCGLVGLRATVGRLAHSRYAPGMDPPLSIQVMAVDGPIARSIDDLRLAYAGMAAFSDPRDPSHVPGAVAPPTPKSPRRVGLLRDVGAATPSPAVNTALDEAAERLLGAGYEVDEIEQPLLEEAWRLWWLLAWQDIRVIMPLIEQVGDEAIKKVTAHCDAIAVDWWGENPGLIEYMKGYARRSTLRSHLAQFLQDYPVVLLPISAEPAFVQDADIASLESCRRAITAGWSMMAISLLDFPALAVPTGVTDGLPAGVQLLGRRFDEVSLLDVGAVIEAGSGILTPIAPR
jgi:amidase